MKKMIISHGSCDVWTENINETVELFVGFVQLLSDKTAMTFKRMALVKYPVHAALLNLFVRRMQ